MNLNANFVPGGYEYDDYSSDDESFHYGHHNGEQSVEPISEDVDLLPPTREQNIETLLKMIEMGTIDQIQEILDNDIMRGFDIDSLIAGRDWTLLMHACFEARPEVVSFLLEERGASSTKTTRRYETPSMIACKSITMESEDIVKVLKVLSKHPMRIDALDSRGQTTLMYASDAGHLNAVEYLTTAFNPFLDACDHEGQTALMLALLGKHTDVASYLINLGADITVKNKRRESAMDIAEKKRLHEIIELFPKPEEVYKVPCEFTDYNSGNMFPGTGEISPLYFPDVNKMLIGMECADFIENFAKARVNLEDFLTISDEKLKQIGIMYPFQRNVIKQGLKNFFNEPWKNSSVFMLQDFSDIEVTGYDFLIFFANVLKQTMILKCHMIQMSRSVEQAKLVTSHLAHSNFDRLDDKQIIKFRENVDRLRRVLMEFNQNSRVSSLDTQTLNSSPKIDGTKKLGNAFKYAIFVFSSTILLFVFRRFTTR